MNEIDEYLATVSEPARSTLEKVRSIIRAAVPKETTEGMSYGVAAFKYKGPLIGFAAFPKHCSLFVMSGSLLDGFQPELEKYETSKGTIRFALDKPLPAVLLKKLVKAKLAEVENKKRR